MNIGVTGANGFIGRELCNILFSHGHIVRGFGRSASGVVEAPSLLDGSSWREKLQSVEVVIHLAGRAHVLRDHATDPLAEFRAVNVDGTLCVARAAFAAGVRRFVFVSSIGVLGNESLQTSFSEKSTPAPVEPYAVSKYEAEVRLRELECAGGFEVIIVRPPLVYGAHVKGNFARLLKLIASGMPLPLGSIDNRRSFVGVTNLSEMLMLCATLTQKPGDLFVVSDGEDVSTPELLQMLSAAMKKRAHIFRFPVSFLRGLAEVTGRLAEFRGLAGNLEVDSRFARIALGWSPRKSMEAGIQEMVGAFLSQPQ